MKLSVLAPDYDGTTAHNDPTGTLVREAIRAVRPQGVTVILATGRTLDELRRVAGDLTLFDDAVPENGAVLHIPGNTHTSDLAPTAPGRYLDELRRRGIPHRSGECLVDAVPADYVLLAAGGTLFRSELERRFPIFAGRWARAGVWVQAGKEVQRCSQNCCSSAG